MNKNKKLSLTVYIMIALALGFIVPVIEIPISGEPADTPRLSFMDQIVGFFPNNMFMPLATADMMQIIIMALFIGFAIVKVGEKARLVADIIVSLNEVVTKILSFIMALAPLGVFCMLCPAVAVNGSSILGSYAALIGVAYLCFLFRCDVDEYHGRCLLCGDYVETVSN